jgi:thiamine-monophosphate kinase
VHDAEDEVIRRILAAAPPVPEGVLGAGDDAAVVPGPRDRRGGRDALVVTTDTMVEGTHWDHRLDAADVGWKLVAVNVSDLAAMGARPAWATLALTLAAPLEMGWVDGFAAGLGAAARRWGVTLVGGDTTRGPCRVATLTLGGSVPATAPRGGSPGVRGRGQAPGRRPSPSPVLRSGARPGDDLWVSGTLGLAAEALLAPMPSERALAWLRRPVPPLELGLALASGGLATAMMDLSDGLRRDLGRLCAASGVGATVDPATLPGDAALAWKVGFGEDYQLLFAAAPRNRDAIACIGEEMAISLTRIGAIVEAPGTRLSDGTAWPAPLFGHFPERAC